MQVLPGSANLIGGRGVTVEERARDDLPGDEIPRRAARPEDGLRREPEARLRRQATGSPMTRMGNVAGYRQAFADAQDYMRRLRQEYDAKLAWSTRRSARRATRTRRRRTPPKRDLQLETLAGVMRGDILVHIHCYRADEMATMLDIADEFGFRIAAFHHGVEAYKVADRLAERGICGALWADWWGFKMEAYDGIQENLALVDRPQGGCADRALRFGGRHPAPEPGSGEGDDARPACRHGDHRRSARSAG